MTMQTSIRIAAALAAMALGTQLAAADPIVIGLSSPQTGGAAYLGQHQRWGAELAIEEINTAGGAIGEQLELSVQDNQCNPTQGAASAEQLISVGKVSAIVGALCSSATLSIMPIIEKAKIPLVVETSTSPKITEMAGVGGNTWTFRINPSDQELAIGLARYLIADGKIKKVAFAGEDTDYGRGGHAALKAVLEKNGVDVGDGDFFGRDTQDFSAFLTRMGSDKPDAIAVYLNGADELNFLRQYRASGLTIPLTGRVEFSELQEGVVESGAINGATSVFPYSEQITVGDNTAFVERFRKKFGELPNAQSYEGYTAIKLIADAIERAKSAEPAKIRDALENAAFKATLGDVLKFDDHHQAHPSAVILQIENSKVVVKGLFNT
ncbi:ABC transporter substrate-binding protein [Mesorhizobium sp. INR15]|uniref:ABC transporter substrate-binding protein n=1 Tax=Mesorhizobium sp. INR15 TaxID=2654248 RepID=UPI0018969519|nr:ABC transporter substrate-binding protein [Mesorhizobium sp. INR15]QPC94555.1 ABC transporter substrate-binding protein [Mesorhizobium sp. INR15]